MVALWLMADGAKSAASAWLLRLGGVGLILVGFIDNSVIPTFGSMDIFLVILAAQRPQEWWYYAAMATIGAVFGAYPTYKIGREGGKTALEKKVPKEKVQKVYKKFEAHGAWAIVLPSMVPPPFPLSPFLVAAGALKLSLRKFFGSLAVGRGIRYFVTAWLGAHYSKQLVAFWSRYYRPILWAAIALGVLAGVAVLGFWWWHKRKQRGKGAAQTHPSEHAA